MDAYKTAKDVITRRIDQLNIPCGAKLHLRNLVSDQIDTISRTIGTFDLLYLRERHEAAEPGINDELIHGFKRLDLSDREVEFLRHCTTELTYKEIAQKMNTNPRAIDNLRDILFYKLDCRSRVGIVMFAIRAGISNPKISEELTLQTY